MHWTKVMGVAFLCIGMISCGKDEDSEGSSGGVDLEVSPLFELTEIKQNPYLTEVSKDDVLAELAKVEDIYNDAPAFLGLLEEDCIAEVFAMDKVSIDIGGTIVKSYIQTDLTECFQKSLSNTLESDLKATATKADVDFATWYQCADLKLPTQTNITFDDYKTAVQETGGCDSETAASGDAFFLKMNIGVEAEVEGKTISFNQTAWTVTRGTDDFWCKTTPTDTGYDMNPCTVVESQYNDENIAQVFDAGFESDARQDYIKIELPARSADAMTNRFFESGTANINFNGWEGTIEYQGVSANPIATLTKDDEEVSGEIDQDNASKPTPKELYTVKGITEVAYENGGDQTGSAYSYVCPMERKYFLFREFGYRVKLCGEVKDSDNWVLSFDEVSGEYGDVYFASFIPGYDDPVFPTFAIGVQVAGDNVIVHCKTGGPYELGDLTLTKTEALAHEKLCVEEPAASYINKQKVRIKDDSFSALVFTDSNGKEHELKLNKLPDMPTDTTE